MFTGIWAKISAGLGAALAFLLLLLKVKNNQIDNLEQENAAHEAKDKIQDSMKQAETKAEAKEDEANKSFDDSNWRDRI
jgi:hypothetical protein